MPQEPQGAVPSHQPLRLQPDFNRLQAEVRALRGKINPDADTARALMAKEQEVIEFIRAYEDQL